MELSLSSRPLGRWLFGKLPGLGDFFSRGLDFALRDAIDHWLSGEMEAAQARFGDDFERRYFQAPPWIFVDRDAQGQWSGGAMCASVDRVGRKFPLLIGAPAADGTDAAGIAGGCLDALYRAIHEGWDADRLHHAALIPAAPAWRPDGPEWALIGVDGPALILPGRFATDVIPSMLEVAA